MGGMVSHKGRKVREEIRETNAEMLKTEMLKPCGLLKMGNIEQPTSNNQHPTTNIEWEEWSHAKGAKYAKKFGKQMLK